MKPFEIGKYTQGRGWSRGRGQSNVAESVVEPLACSSTERESESKMNEDLDIQDESIEPVQLSVELVQEYTFDYCRTGAQPHRFLKPLAQLIQDNKCVLRTEIVQFVGEKGKGSGPFLREFLCDVRDSILSGNFGGRQLFENAGETVLPIPDRDTALEHKYVFFILGVAMGNLIHHTQYCIPYVSPYVTFAWMYLNNGWMPPLMLHSNYLDEITDPIVLQACEWLQEIIETDGSRTDDAGIINNAFKWSFITHQGVVDKYRAIDLKKKILYHHFIGCRIESIGNIVEGLKACGLRLNYFDIEHRRHKIAFPTEVPEIVVADLLQLLQFPTGCQWLSDLIINYVDSIQTDQVALRYFWRMCTAEDVINSRSAVVEFIPCEGAIIAILICRRKVYIPNKILPELFPLLFLTDFAFNLDPLLKAL